MTKLGLGPIGASLTAADWHSLLDAAAELDDLGYSALWLSGGKLDSLDRLSDLLRATTRVRIGTGIIPVDRFGAGAVAEAYAEAEAAHPGRFLVGLGGAHGAKPLGTLRAFLDELDADRPGAPGRPAVPAGRRVLAALGPRMLGLARERTAGALPILGTPAHTAQARTILGDDRSLVVQQCVVVGTDAALAREAGRGTIGFLAGVPGYAAHFRRMGFTNDDIIRISDRLVDALVAWGDPATVAGRIGEQRAAGADQVAVTVLGAGPNAAPIEQWRQLAGVLLP